MQVSVIIPVYNEEKSIEECLDSLSKQAYKNLEIIVVDDGSTDRTLDKLAGVKILKQSHKGAGAARNLGAKHAKGEILVFVDADMTFDDNFIKNLVASIVLGYAKGTFSKDERLSNSDNAWARYWNINRGLPPNKMHTEDYPDKQKVFRAILKKEFDRGGGFDEKAGYIDDWNLSEKLGYEASAAPRAVFYHKNPESLKEVFIQSRWAAKRKYKMGIIGGLIKSWFPINLSPRFIVFKIVFGIGATIGVLEYYLLRKVSK